uniref:C-type lectin domain-containing protein n=1 Tax=Panagrolaimus sp. PS1159 TaxID=55785 RepID=A0AC35FCI9_9BILA
MLGIVLLFLLIENLKADCPPNFIEWNSNCFSFFNNSTGFADAELSCKNTGGHLASIHDGFTNALLAQEAVKRFHESTETDFWIGATNLMKPPIWNWTDGTFFDFNDWKKGEPQNISGNGCAALSMSDGFWTAQDCFKSKPFACSSVNVVATTPITYPDYINCTEGFVYLKPSHSCYGNSNTKNVLGWRDGQLHCEGLGGNLASIHSYEEEIFIKTFVYFIQEYVWIGLYSVDQNKHFQWSDGTPIDYLDWINGRPFTNHSGCTVLGVDGFRDDFECTVEKKVLCKISVYK